MRTGFDPKAAERRQNEHDAIAKALADRDAKALKTALRSHSQTTARVILATLAAERKLRSAERPWRKRRAV